MGLKNLANCTPTEFLKQTVLMKRAVEKWLTATDIAKIMKTAPELIAVTEDMDDDALKETAKKNVKRKNEQARKNISKVFDVVCEDHPQETLEVLALSCFVAPEDIDTHPITEYLAAFNEMIGNEDVIGFFISLLRWGRLLIKAL